MDQNREIRIVIADDHPIFRDGVNRLLQSEPGFRVVGEAGDGADAVRICTRLRPDVLLLDVMMPGTGGLQALRQLSLDAPSVRTLVLTAGLDSVAVSTALELGARGVLLKASATSLLFESIRSITKEEYWLGCNAAGQMIDTHRDMTGGVTESRAAATNKYRLTPRELEVVTRVASGESNKQIGEALSMRENTVKHHLTSIFDKTGVFSRLELAVFAMNHGLIEN
jgi:two-component system, NarL family, nitrate/nitrite response regulator NarL